MMKLFEMIRRLSQVKSNVLIIGESGTGKELFARALHYKRPGRRQPICGGELRGDSYHADRIGVVRLSTRGVHTGAIRDKVGYFEAANGGTLFLDEVSTLPTNVQSSLLRVLEERAIVPVGDTRPRPVDVRIVAASNRDLAKMVSEGTFREDLLFRLNVVQLVLPPLRQRRQGYTTAGPTLPGQVHDRDEQAGAGGYQRSHAGSVEP